MVGLLITLAGVSLSWQHAAAGFIIIPNAGHPETAAHPLVYAGDSGGLEVVVDDVVAGVMARLVLEIV